MIFAVFDVFSNHAGSQFFLYYTCWFVYIFKQFYRFWKWRVHM